MSSVREVRVGRGTRRRAPFGEEQRDLIRKEEIAARRVPFPWDAKMLPPVDDGKAEGLMG
ncbi:hypothetical protein ABT063_16430 [Streptomyces sp. NPDC002838]|uniref:hypothetical protein n=1 Tax=Streptomyces sp. NPDC002838 TaxID=3154436 RepID=UPI003331DBC3